jgi:hypothetical protein
MTRLYFILMSLVAAGLCISSVSATASGPPVKISAEPAGNAEKELTPEQKFQHRFPQSVRVGDLVGLPVLDDDDSTIGYVKQVVRSPEGKIFLIVPYSARFGWARTELGKRPVAVPIEVVTILTRQLDSLDMSRDDFDEAPSWMPSQGQPVPLEEKTLIALGRR